MNFDISKHKSTCRLCHKTILKGEERFSYADHYHNQAFHVYFHFSCVQKEFKRQGFILEKRNVLSLIKKTGLK